MKVKEKHLKIKQKEITENEFVMDYVKSDLKLLFKSISEKHNIKLKEFVDKFYEGINVSELKIKNEDEFLDIILDKVIKPVFKDNNIDLV